MATNRKLGRTTDIRNAMLKNLTTDLFAYGKVETTAMRAKEVKAIADSLIALAIKEKDNYEEIEVTIKKAKLDTKGNKSCKRRSQRKKTKRQANKTKCKKKNDEKIKQNKRQ